MGHNAQAGQVVVVERGEVERRKIIGNLLAFVLGIAVTHAAHVFVAPALAGQDAPRTVSKVLWDIGEYLCKRHEGLANMARIGTDLYSFECRELATFPRVQVTAKKDTDPDGSEQH